MGSGPGHLVGVPTDLPPCDPDRSQAQRVSRGIGNRHPGSAYTVAQPGPCAGVWGRAEGSFRLVKRADEALETARLVR
jgi:hypothetical protein